MDEYQLFGSVPGLACPLRAEGLDWLAGFSQAAIDEARLTLAGEHTQSARLAYADGALTSGIREAKRLLGTPAVCISVNHT